MDNEYLYRVRESRKSLTPQEKTLWELLRSRKLKGFKFRRQHPIGPYIADFCCPQKRIVIEVDGAFHAEQKDEDQKRTDFLMDQGYSVVRFWNHQIDQEPGSVLEHVERMLESIKRQLTPFRAKMYQWVNPLPTEGEGGRRRGDRVRVE